MSVAQSGLTCPHVVPDAEHLPGSSHMLDLSEESKEENIEICAKYFTRMAKIDLWLEMEIGITGGEEDGVDNTGVDNNSLYTQPEDIWDIYKALSAISPMFSIAAGFGNVHGVYKRELVA